MLGRLRRPARGGKEVVQARGLANYRVTTICIARMGEPVSVRSSRAAYVGAKLIAFTLAQQNCRAPPTAHAPRHMPSSIGGDRNSKTGRHGCTHPRHAPVDIKLGLCAQVCWKWNSEQPWNLALRTRVELDSARRFELSRFENMIETARAEAEAGPFLFGPFCAADAMLAPVATRIVAYGLNVGPITRAWIDAIYTLPAFHRWEEEAERELERRPVAEHIGKAF